MTGAALALASEAARVAQPAAWSALCCQCDRGEGDDATAAALLSALLGCDPRTTASLAKLAERAGGEESDPWPALIRHVGAPSAAVERARTAAAHAVRLRRRAIERVRLPSSPPAAKAPAARARAPSEAEAWRMASRLRQVELRILDDALRALDERALSGLA